MAHLSGWQWALAAALLTAALVLGGWWQRQREPEPEPELEPAEPQASRSSPADSELQEARTALANLQQQLEQREADLQEAREEAELILLQLHQVQEELEHYFLESRDLQQKLEACTTQLEPALALSPQHLEQLQRIKTRLVGLFAALPSSSVAAPVQHPQLLRLVERQQQALRRFQRLQLAQR